MPHTRFVDVLILRKMPHLYLDLFRVANADVLREYWVRYQKWPRL